ncbi:hypothetical protein HanRHA438_Chr03g0111451 [Helianthus annuus]|uniref:Uncharacterized protein n=1 Tax=Helianthus annuus TaxID=4232 RepID=A0A9K3JES4_HELAN|nr:hypothetical protein HanXRQr2_Chr03g0100401 [Helianthus annuus]KAJ0592317.1 hypothetical protein HanHA300_Chr03g0083611 [Helianthus annuus]KAJ0599833.1 hypothetical protein HanIR_Chr03g0109581 [Helianthus annuus]KAJ0607302.1 hypothetical protein HanHA89_Chr03g0095101 [Helianthus annuus]KAJ0767362.1 hypothetical protein HanLR1_Chr03g0088401 [Helianthus annuus]
MYCETIVLECDSPALLPRFVVLRCRGVTYCVVHCVFSLMFNVLSSVIYCVYWLLSVFLV